MRLSASFRAKPAKEDNVSLIFLLISNSTPFVLTDSKFSYLTWSTPFTGGNENKLLSIKSLKLFLNTTNDHLTSSLVPLRPSSYPVLYSALRSGFGIIV